ncbi:hypothetical protein [Anaeromicrobium sediminis]|uniref:Uncharacterized protein n=1 Tax=Anaeromicrobium sediminis TaxID=1478221 RepID=A0A267MAB2_9FIRM|nr:hypothetical protein [Anaeromicrobium sediminis]PAB56511.1 hypothetical protein CCE28_20805 [Anaeromicrobium sediminis]
MLKLNYESNIWELVNTIIKEIFPQFYRQDLINKKIDYINQLDEIFNEIEEVYRNKNRYNMHWAFDNAQTKFNDFYLQMTEGKIKSELEYCKTKKKILTEFGKLDKTNRKMIHQIKRRFRIYSTLSSLVSIVDIMISLILILVISEISHRGEYFITSAYMSFLFVLFFALLKVTLERYYIMPKVEKWGWKLYNRGTKKFKKNLSILTAMSLVIHESIDRKHDTSEVVSILRTSIKESIGE